MSQEEIWEKLKICNKKGTEPFEESGVANVNKVKRCRLLRTLVEGMKTTKPSPASKHHKEKHLSWKKKYMKTDFSAVIGCRAILDETDNWVRGWIFQWNNQPVVRGGVIFCRQ